MRSDFTVVVCCARLGMKSTSFEVEGFVVRTRDAVEDVIRI